MADDKVKVKFLRDEVYETEGRNQGTKFTSGRVYTMTADQAGRWLRRDAAELVEGEDAADEDGPPKPRRGRPPKAKAVEGGGGDDDAEDEGDDDDELAPTGAPTPPRPPAPPVRQPEPLKSEPPKDPGPRFVAQPLKAPDKGR